MSEKEEAIRQSVLNYYGQKARAELQKLEKPILELPAAENSACCSNYQGDQVTAATIAELPPDITEFSLGCGNPVGIARIRTGETVLDLGSGGGLDCFLASRATGPAGQVFGVDMNLDMIMLARRNAARLGVRNVEFRLGEMESLPFETGSIDLVLSNCVINLVPDKDAVFREAFRVLKLGGRLCVADIVTEALLPNSLTSDPEQWCGCIAGAIPREAYLEKLRNAGFKDVQVLQMGPSCEGAKGGVQLFSATISAAKD